MGIEVNNFVSWPITGGNAFGQVVSVNDNVAKVRTPTKQVVDANISELVVLAEDVYNDYVQNLVKDIIGVDIMADKANLESQIAEINKTVESLKVESLKKDEMIAQLTKDVTAKVTELTQAQTQVQTLQNQINEIELARKGEARFNEIKNLSTDALTVVNADEIKAKSTLANMSDEVYALTLNMANAFVKLTQVTQTALPKATDQTVTAEPKSTEQVITASLDEEDTGIDGDPVNVDDTSEPNSEFLSAIAKVISNKTK